MGRTPLLLLTTLLALPLGAQDIPSMAEQDVAGATPALALAVVHDGDLQFFQAWGSADRDAQVAFTGEELIPAPWLTPVLMAVVVRALDTAGQLDAHAPLSTLVPDLPEGIQEVTLHHLLTSTAGLDDAPLGQDQSWEDALAALGNAAVVGPPGIFYSPSRYSLPVVADILERALGMPLPQIVEAAIFTPLGMTRSTFDPPPGSPVVTGYAWSSEAGGIAPVPSPEWGHDGIPVVYTTPAEVLQFLSAMVGGGIAGMDPWANAPRDLVPLHDGRVWVDGFWVGPEDEIAWYRTSDFGNGYWARVRAYPETRSVVLAMGSGTPPLPTLTELYRQVGVLVGDAEAALALSGATVVARGSNLAAPFSLIRRPAAWAGRYRNGELMLVLRHRQGRLFFFDGSNEFPLYQDPDGRLQLDAPGLSAPPIVLFEHEDARFAFFMDKVYALESPDG